MLDCKIVGAGSIGNHLAHAARSLGWGVTLCDVDPKALERARDEIYPARYGAWDDAIRLCRSADAPRSGHDVIAIGTPPDSHVPLALEALRERPRALLVEKPLCTPVLDRAQELADRAREDGVAVFVGYNHAVARSTLRLRALVREIGPVETLDFEFREHWGGIFAAHPWLAGPHDSYLGFSDRGGGASGEHSHALHLWQHVAHEVGAGRVVEVTADMETVRDEGTDYDSLCLLNLRTEGGLPGRVVQDVVTKPPRKWGRVQGRDGWVELSLSATGDAVSWQRGGDAPRRERFEKTRPDDFLAELEHVARVLDGGESAEPIGLERGLETMLVLAAAHRSAREGRRVRIEHEKGCTLDALRIA